MTTRRTRRLTRRFYRRDAETLAEGLLGQVLVRRLPDGEELSGRIIEVEAYLGIPDRAAHTFGGRRTERNEAMWLDGGHAYVYFVYGMHWCFNVVSDRAGVPTACLVRALEPLTGVAEMQRRRHGKPTRELCSGPGRLTQALAIDRTLNGVDLVTSDELFIVPGARGESFEAERTPRIGVDYAGDWAPKPLRFVWRSTATKKTPLA